jgi:NAD(P)H-dependent FMN reductase
MLLLAYVVTGLVWIFAAMKILGLSGSLRSASINSALLRAAARLAPPSIEIDLFQLGELPLFNPDLESSLPPQIVRLHEKVAAADALLIAGPEYAHGISGVLKNALDWLVSFEPFVNKPVAIFNSSPRSHHADVALREVLKTMSAHIVESASIAIPLRGYGVASSLAAGQGWSEAAMVADANIADLIERALRALFNEE